MKSEHIDVGKSGKVVKLFQEQREIILYRNMALIGNEAFDIESISEALLFATSLMTSYEQSMMELTTAIQTLHPEFKEMHWEEIVCAIQKVDQGK